MLEKGGLCKGLCEYLPRRIESLGVIGFRLFEDISCERKKYTCSTWLHGIQLRPKFTSLLVSSRRCWMGCLGKYCFSFLEVINLWLKGCTEIQSWLVHFTSQKKMAYANAWKCRRSWLIHGVTSCVCKGTWDDGEFLEGSQHRLMVAL